MRMNHETSERAARPCRRLLPLVVLALTLASSSALAAPPRLRVSDNQRFLVRGDGKPFFWLGDTAWELFHRLDRADTEVYLRDRARKGFTVIQAVVLAELDGLHAQSVEGFVPLVDDDPARPSEAYFKHVDWVVARANALGLVIALLPTWGDKWNKKWGDGPEIFSEQSAAAFGSFLARRYREADLVWVLGGDRPVESAKQRAIVHAMARGLREADGDRHLITFHPPGASGSSGWFHDEPWLDFNMRQNGHGADFANYAKTRADYDRTPIKPVLDAEPLYEDHPLSFDAERAGHSIAADVRKPLYWNLFSGAFGHTYGHHSVWQMWTPARVPVNAPLLTWKQALAQPGAAQMQHARWLLESRPFLTRVPDDTLIVRGPVPTAVPGAGRYRMVATRDVERTFALVYAPIGRPFTVRMSALAARQIRAWWFDPRTGKAVSAGTYPGEGERTFSPPQPGELLDWVLVLDDAAKRYPPPGTRSKLGAPLLGRARALKQ
jgi:hypothetical protein